MRRRGGVRRTLRRHRVCACRRRSARTCGLARTFPAVPSRARLANPAPCRLIPRRTRRTAAAARRRSGPVIRNGGGARRARRDPGDALPACDGPRGTRRRGPVCSRVHPGRALMERSGRCLRTCADRFLRLVPVEGANRAGRPPGGTRPPPPGGGGRAGSGQRQHHGKQGEGADGGETGLVEDGHIPCPPGVAGRCGRTPGRPPCFMGTMLWANLWTAGFRDNCRFGNPALQSAHGSPVRAPLPGETATGAGRVRRPEGAVNQCPGACLAPVSQGLSRPGITLSIDRRKRLRRERRDAFPQSDFRRAHCLDQPLPPDRPPLPCQYDPGGVPSTSGRSRQINTVFRSVSFCMAIGHAYARVAQCGPRAYRTGPSSAISRCNQRVEARHAAGCGNAGTRIMASDGQTRDQDRDLSNQHGERSTRPGR